MIIVKVSQERLELVNESVFAQVGCSITFKPQIFHFSDSLNFVFYNQSHSALVRKCHHHLVTTPANHCRLNSIILWVLGVLSSGVKRPGHEADH